ncbi:hypothetical protein AB3N04_05550 [Alkalihalophilus sp. As8PL]|uniref:Uncharacterized protein n=1 Tax=Alkalihalophilus sp. As8PL TaxID=3237103 RepID=A0AB39BW62_9BACI
MKTYLALFIFIFLLVGCSTEEKRVLDRLKPEEENKFSVHVFLDETTLEEYQHRIVNIFEEHSLLGDKITLHGFIILNENTTHDVDYKEVFDLDRLPDIIVFNKDGIVFRTYEVEELKAFFLRGKE